jgi:HAD superfamily hydrolase (TIGR01509 family)
MLTKKNSEKIFAAAFFDRDNTLIHRDPAAAKQRAGMIERWSGKPLAVPDDLFFHVLNDRRLLTVENEMAFWKEYFSELLRAQGVTKNLSTRVNELFEAYWLKGIVVYPETVFVLRWFRERGFRMGVISDTFPSLRLTIEAAGLDTYFDCYVCSDQVGVMKPAPPIYQAALDALGVTAEESLYVDGARDLGFTAFHICRDGEPKEPWDIASLSDMIAYLS